MLRSDISLTNTSNKNDFLLLYSNVDSLMSKREELCKLAHEIKPDIICLTETLPKNKHVKIDVVKEFNIPKYNLFTNENAKRGIAIYYKDHYDAKLCDTLNLIEFSECLWTTVNINKINVLVGCVYRSPSGDKNDSTNKLTEMLMKTEQVKYDKIIVTGDFNYPEINWNSNLNGNCETKFIDCLNELYFTQLVNKPTRRRQGQKSNLLDLLITDDNMMIKNIDHNAPLGKSDHETLIISLDLPKYDRKKGKIKYKYSKTDFKGMREHLSLVDWDKINNMSLNDA